jgi:hypothetical protein
MWGGVVDVVVAAVFYIETERSWTRKEGRKGRTRCEQERLKEGPGSRAGVWGVRVPDFYFCFLKRREKEKEATVIGFGLRC